MRPGLRACALAVLLICPAGGALAHGVRATVAGGESVVVTVAFEDGSPMAFESCEVHGPDGGPPFQVGRTDRLGRVAFVPDRPGAWQVKVVSGDGHGAVVPVDVDRALNVSPTAPAGAGRGWKLVTGVGVLLGIFGFVNLISRRSQG